MKRMMSMALAAGVWAWMAVAATRAGTDASPAPEVPEWAAGLGDAIGEGVQLLQRYRLRPEPAAARAALVEALIQAAEPAVVFLDDEKVALRYRRLSEREWDVGLTLVATDYLPQVAGVRENSPAAAAGIQPGESIEKVGGRDVLGSHGLAVVREWLTGGPDARIEVGVRDEDGASRVVALERVRRMESSLADVEELPGDMGYIRVEGLYAGAAAEIAAALDGWRDSDVFGAILDLRGAAGTAEEEVAPVAARFAKKGTVIYTRADREGKVLDTVKAPDATPEILPVMVLIDECTSGAAELLAAVLGGSVRGAMLIGRTTSGDPMIREPLQLSSGRHALLATRQVRTSDGRVYDGAKGVQPDVVITDAALSESVYEPETPVLRRGRTITEEEKIDRALRDRTRNDTYLRRATDVLLGLQALGYDKRR